eukprot:3442586-Pyramimonas_sp.AAC.1
MGASMKTFLIELSSVNGFTFGGSMILSTYRAVAGKGKAPWFLAGWELCFLSRPRSACAFPASIVTSRM